MLLERLGRKEIRYTRVNESGLEIENAEVVDGYIKPNPSFDWDFISLTILIDNSESENCFEFKEANYVVENGASCRFTATVRRDDKILR